MHGQRGTRMSGREAIDFILIYQAATGAHVADVECGTGAGDNLMKRGPKMRSKAAIFFALLFLAAIRKCESDLAEPFHVGRRTPRKPVRLVRAGSGSLSAGTSDPLGRIGFLT
jgi:hypothetical protein